jgi:hypothetical protein
MDAVEVLALEQELKGTDVPDDLPVSVLDLFVRWFCDKALFVFLEIPVVLKREAIA